MPQNARIFPGMPFPVSSLNSLRRIHSADAGAACRPGAALFFSAVF